MKPHRAILLLMALLAVFSLAAAPGAGAQDEDDESDKLQPVPDQVMAKYIAAVKASPYYAVADALRPGDDAERQRERWQEETGLPIEFATSNFLELLTEDEIPVFDGAEYVLEIEWEDTPDGFEMPVAVLNVMTTSSEDDEEEEEVSSWAVPFEKLRPVDFEFVSAIDVIHPLNRMLSRQSVEETPLPALLANLARLGESDYAINHSLAGEVKVSLDLRNRRISECLQLAAHVAGWKVLFVSAERLEDGVIADVPESIGLDFEEFVHAWRMRDHLLARNPDAGPIETPLDAITIALRNVSRYVKEDRVVVTMVPADQDVAGEEREDDDDDDR